MKFVLIKSNPAKRCTHTWHGK